MQIFAPDGAQIIEKAQSGQRAPLCLNGASNLSHMGPYSDGGIGILSP